MDLLCNGVRFAKRTRWSLHLIPFLLSFLQPISTFLLLLFILGLSFKEREREIEREKKSDPTLSDIGYSCLVRWSLPLFSFGHSFWSCCYCCFHCCRLPPVPLVSLYLTVRARIGRASTAGAVPLHCLFFTFVPPLHSRRVSSTKLNWRQSVKMRKRTRIYLIKRITYLNNVL